jgi:site-specific DNA-adenine methylase
MKYINTPFNYTGSKFKLLEQIIPDLDTEKKYFIDLFSGGGSVYTNVLHLYDKVLVNDIISELIGIHKALLESDDIINSSSILVIVG